MRAVARLAYSTIYGANPDCSFLLCLCVILVLSAWVVVVFRVERLTVI